MKKLAALLLLLLLFAGGCASGPAQSVSSLAVVPKIQIPEIQNTWELEKTFVKKNGEELSLHFTLRALDEYACTVDSLKADNIPLALPEDRESRISLDDFQADSGDYNFDGFQDFRFLAGFGTASLPSYYYYLWDSETSGYQFSVELSDHYGACEFDVKTETVRLSVDTNQGRTGHNLFRWKNGKLLLRAGCYGAYDDNTGESPEYHYRTNVFPSGKGPNGTNVEENLPGEPQSVPDGISDIYAYLLQIESEYLEPLS